MQSKNFALLSFIAVLIVIISGCTTPGTGAGNIGGELSLSIQPTQIYEGETSEVVITAKNSGSKTMLGNSILWFYGPDFQHTWRAYDDLAPATSGGVIIDTEDFLPGEIFEVYGSIEYIGDVPEGLNRPQEHTFYARLCYPYYTSTDSIIKFVTRNEAKLINDKASQSTINSKGPIQAELVRKSNTITVRGTGNAVVVGGQLSGTININYGSQGLSHARLSLPFKIKNVGNGFSTANGECALGPDVNVKDQNTVQIRLLINGQDHTDSCNKQIVKIRDNGEGSVYCSLEDVDLSDPSNEIHINLEMYYDYYVTQKQTVKVLDSTYY